MMSKNRWPHWSAAGAGLGVFCAALGCGSNGSGGNQGDSGALNTAVNVTVTVAQCPVINAILVAPDRLEVGQSTVLMATIGLAPNGNEAGSEADAGDDGESLAGEGGVVGSYGGSEVDVDPIGLSWSAPSGRFGDATAEDTTFTCTAPGTVMLTLTATHQGCQVTVAVPVDCLGDGGA